MEGCTAPVEGHRTASGRANCPVCRYGSSRSRYSYTPREPYPTRPTTGGVRTTGGSSGGGGGGTRRTRSGTTVSYSPTEWRTVTPLAREAAVVASAHPEHRDLFLCHAWDDRAGVAKDFYDQLVSSGATVWFSETDVVLGKPLMREIDRGLAMSRVGVVLVTPAMLRSLPAEGVADKELSALLATDRLIPVVCDTTFEALRDVSMLLASRSGFTIGDGVTMHEVAQKLAAAVAVESNDPVAGNALGL